MQGLCKGVDTRLSPASVAYLFSCQKAERVKSRVGAESVPRAAPECPSPARCSLTPRIKQLKNALFPLSQQLRSCEVGRQHNLTQQRLLMPAQPHRCWNSPQHRRAEPGAAPRAKHTLCSISPTLENEHFWAGVRVWHRERLAHSDGLSVSK